MHKPVFWNKIIHCALFLLLTHFIVVGQNTYSLSLKVQDEKLKPVEGANVLVYRQGDSVFVKGDITDKVGLIIELGGGKGRGIEIEFKVKVEAESRLLWRGLPGYRLAGGGLWW